MLWWRWCVVFRNTGVVGGMFVAWRRWSVGHRGAGVVRRYVLSSWLVHLRGYRGVGRKLFVNWKLWSTRGVGVGRHLASL